MTEIEFENRDGVGLITFARPDTLNVFSPGMMAGLGELYRRCDADDAVRVVVVTGRGAAFCAGADLLVLSGGRNVESTWFMFGSLVDQEEMARVLSGAASGLLIPATGFSSWLSCPMLPWLPPPAKQSRP